MKIDWSVPHKSTWAAEVDGVLLNIFEYRVGWEATARNGKAVASVRYLDSWEDAESAMSHLIGALTGDRP